jgi:hypothetical protein
MYGGILSNVKQEVIDGVISCFMGRSGETQSTKQSGTM